MTAHEIYRHLSATGWWSDQPRSMRWAAARYYAGVESRDELFLRATHKPTGVGGSFGEVLIRPDITPEQAEEIIMLR